MHGDIAKTYSTEVSFDHGHKVADNGIQLGENIVNRLTQIQVYVQKHVNASHLANCKPNRT